MIIGIQGSKAFYDYAIFLNAMTRLLRKMDSEDTELVFLTAGPHKVNDMIYEFVNVSNWKSRGIKTKVVKMPPKALAERMDSIDEFVYLCLPKEPVSFLVKEAEDHELIPQISRYP